MSQRRPPTFISVWCLFACALVLACSPTTSPYVAAANAPIASLTTNDIETNLNTLLQAPGIDAYKFYLLELPKPIALSNVANNYYNNLKANPSRTAPHQPYSQVNTTIEFALPIELEALPNRYDAICVTLSGFGNPVPIRAAESMAASFANGFVTRLVLGEYVRQWAKGGAKIKPDDLDMHLTPKGTPTLPMNAFLDRSKYDADFDASLTKLLQTNSLQATGTMWGWQAAGDLDSYSGADRKFVNASWALLRSRYNSEQLGQMVGYTLSYLLGYAKVQGAIRSSTVQPTQDVGKILATLGEDKEVIHSKALLTNFQDLLLTEFYATTTSDIPNKERILSEEFAFILGFQKGLSQASDKVFDEVFTTAYGLGYKDGFRDGYNKGYADGFRDGYASGYKKAWDDANMVIKNLQDQLDSARSNGGWLKTACDVVKVAGPVIGTILSRFPLSG